MNKQKVVDLLDRYKEAVALPESDIPKMLYRDATFSVIRMECQMLIDEDGEYYQYLKSIHGLKHRCLSRQIKMILIASMLSLISLAVGAIVVWIITKVFKPSDMSMEGISIVAFSVLCFWNGIVWLRLVLTCRR